MDSEKLIYVVVGAIIGFALSLAKDWLMEGKKQKEESKKLKRERLEELYVLVGNWSSALMVNSLSLLSVMNNKLNYNEHNQLSIKSSEKVTYDFNRLEMILDIYAPELTRTYKKTINARSILNNISIKHHDSVK